MVAPNRQSGQDMMDAQTAPFEDIGPGIKAVLWDMDGTMIDSEPLHDETFVDALAALGHVPPEGLREQVLGRQESESFSWLANELKLDLDLSGWTAIRYRIYLARTAELRPFAPALDLWQRNAARGLKQGLVSNSDRILLSANIEACGLARAGQVSVARNDVRNGTPDPEPYLRAAWLLGVEPSETAVIEDSPAGVAAGIAAGMQVFLARNAALPEHPVARAIYEVG
jgi:beta-phosphoglucomutase-like phosphatase (HAD superfamily)